MESIKQQSLEFESPRKRKRTCQTQFSDTSSPPSPESGIDLDMASPPWFATSRSNTSNAQGGYTLIIVEEPEQNYRARYESEGTRGPLKGQDDNHPAVKVCGGQPCNGKVYVQLVYEDGSEHGACSLDDSGERRHALVKDIGVSNGMTAIFDDLRIRREKKDTKQKVPGGRKQSKPVVTANERNDKIACLRFTAMLEQPSGPGITVSAKSRPIILDTHQEPAELEWVKPSTASYNGGEEIVIKGTKMTSPKVIFILPSANGHDIELSGAVAKEQSHQNVVVVKVPSLSKHVSGLAEKQKIFASVVVATGKGQLKSNGLSFTFLPDDVCPHCHQRKPNFSPEHVKASASPCLQPLLVPTAEIHSQISQQGSFYPKLGGPPISSVDCGLNSHGSYSFSNSPSQASGLVSYQDRDMLDALHSLSSPESVSSHEEVPEFFNTLDFSEPEQDDIVTPLSLPPETNDVWQSVIKDFVDQSTDLSPENVQNTVFPLWVLAQFNSTHQ
eukprot:Em0022g704a